MKNQKRIEDYGHRIGNLERGVRNSITDVEGVLVGHVTLNDGPVKTGVTAIIPSTGNLFKEKLICASHVINGFGKSVGMMQIDELGTLETPIVLTNTLSVGTGIDGILDYMLPENPEIGTSTGTVNSVVCECNDGFLNDIRGRHVERGHVLEALSLAGADFMEGAIGAGTGMSCYQLKGGIGTASRIVKIEDSVFTLGALVLSNFGRTKDFTLNGDHIGLRIHREMEMKEVPKEILDERDKGSIIVILATDMPLSSRQLKRVAKRSVNGIARTGSFTGNGSGEVVIAFSTANRISHFEKRASVEISILNENVIDGAFMAVTEAVEEAVLNSMVCADVTEGREGNRRNSLKEYL